MRALVPHPQSLFRMLLTQCSRYTICCVSGLFLVGCVANTAYRRGDDPNFKNQLPPSVAPDDHIDCNGKSSSAKCIKNDQGQPEPQRFYLAYIEFDDMGEL